MSVTLRRFFLLILSSLQFISCGNEDESPAPLTNISDTQNDRAEEEEINRDHRYTSIVLEENCGFWTDCDFTVRADFTRRPLVLDAHFVDDGWPAPDSMEEGACDFQVTLTDEETRRLEASADALRFCEMENIPHADEGFDGLFATDAEGTEFMVYKSKDRGQEEEGMINYICSGRAGYYNEMRKLIEPKAPEECPSSYKRLFR